MRPVEAQSEMSTSKLIGLKMHWAQQHNNRVSAAGINVNFQRSLGQQIHTIYWSEAADNGITVI